MALNRMVFTDESTIGVLNAGNAFHCFTLEDTNRGLSNTMSPQEIQVKKVFGKTAIPTGRYRVVLNFSSRFKKVMPLIVNVPGFEGIRIHSGNTAADTEGCILVGMEKQINQILESRNAWAELMKVLEDVHGKESIYITINNLS